jgi:predicted phage tail protein
MDYLKNIAMANPIKETPVLYGEDAKRFANRIANPVPETKERVEEIKQAYEIFQQSLQRGKRKTGQV